MKKLYKLVTLLIILGLFTACKEKEDDPKITISNSEFTVGAEQDSEAKATFSINVDWTTSSISYEGDAKDWLTITPVAGKAGTDQTITMKASANPTVAERKASFTINYGGGKEHKLTITQAVKKDMDITAYFDAKFVVELKKRGYITDATKILLSDVITITSIDVSGEYVAPGEITSLSGIEYFEALTHLSCSYNPLTTLNLSKNTALTNLHCDDNKLTALDLSKNTALTNLDCSWNKLTTLNISKNTALIKLECFVNQFATLDVSNNTALTYLNCDNNKLTTLDVSKNTALTSLICSYNQLTALDFSKNGDLTNLDASYNQLTVLNVSKNTALIELSCPGNKLTVLDVSKHPALTFLNCGNNLIEALDLNNSPDLIHLLCYTNKIITLDMSKNTVLEKLNCFSNQLTNINLGESKVFNMLMCFDNKLTTLDISKNTALNTMMCVSNPGKENIFVVKAWFDSSNIANGLQEEGSTWKFNGETITLTYEKVI